MKNEFTNVIGVKEKEERLNRFLEIFDNDRRIKVDVRIKKKNIDIQEDVNKGKTNTND